MPVQPHSLGLALLSARAAGGLCMQFELDGRGSLDVFPDEAVLTAFEFKSSSAGARPALRTICDDMGTFNFHKRPGTSTRHPVSPASLQACTSIMGVNVHHRWDTQRNSLSAH